MVGVAAETGGKQKMIGGADEEIAEKMKKPPLLE